MVSVRIYGADPETAHNHDEGGYYHMETVKEPPAKIKRRMRRCSGCYNAFYNGRGNVGGRSWCWSLENDENFRNRGGVPRCWRR